MNSLFKSSVPGAAPAKPAICPSVPVAIHTSPAAPQFRDNPINPDYCEGQQPKQRLVPLYTADLPEVHDVIEEMRAIVVC